MRKKLQGFFDRIKRVLISFPVSLIIGVLVGIILSMMMLGWNAFFLGVILTVVIEEFLKWSVIAIKEWQKTHPIKKLLGPIANGEECYLFFSSFFRDLEKPDEFKLLRPNLKKTGPDIEVIGPDFLLGESDALTLALIMSLLSIASVKPNKISVERGDLASKQWVVNSFCIGAHNPLTREILTKFNNPFFIFDNNYTVITKPDLPPASIRQGKEIKKGVYITPHFDTEPTDYGIILKLRNQFQVEKKIIFIIAGIGPAGTSGAAYYLLTHFKEVSTLGDEFGLLIQVPCGFQSAVKVEFDSCAQYYEKH
ncbi:MAG: hypothetical protein GYA36_16295 [Veillonellaceae bacterium]|nr:hypothetical protein [Veillonellaceae bacterium]